MEYKQIIAIALIAIVFIAAILHDWISGRKKKKKE
jgi:hypothetical protein